MKKNSLINQSLLALLLLMYAITGMTAGEMDDAYVELIFIGKGIVIDTATESVVKKRMRKAKGVCYTRLIYDTLSTTYDGDLVCQTAPNVWTVTDAGISLNELASPPGSGYSADDFMTFTNAKGQVVEGYGTHYWRAKLNKKGELVNIIAKSLGAEMFDDSIVDPNDGFLFLGRYNYKGKRVKDSKVPADVRALLP